MGLWDLKKNEKGEVVIGVESVDYFQLIVVQFSDNRDNRSGIGLYLSIDQESSLVITQTVRSGIGRLLSIDREYF